MVMKSPPASALIMVETELALQLLIVALDTPAQPREADELSDGGVGRHRRERELRRRWFTAGPLDEEPLDGSRLMPVFVAVSGSHPHAGEAGPHLPARSLTPRHIPPRARGKIEREVLHRDGPAPRGATNPRRRA